MKPHLLAIVAEFMTSLAAAAPLTSAQKFEPMLDGQRVTLDAYAMAGLPLGAAILSHGFTRSRRTLAGHATAMADAGVLALTPDLPCTNDFHCNARALAALVWQLQQGGMHGAAC
ncbi:MAG: hypothetical protein RL227_797 [Pseudomonadota bacterium]|jgi:hypothetical protein